MPAFSAQARPITNEDVCVLVPSHRDLTDQVQYARYLEQTNNSTLPASWSSQKINGVRLTGHTNGQINGHVDHPIPLSQSYLEGKSVRSVYGLVPLKYALDWPIFASYDELAGCAEWMGGNIPTAEQARSIYSHVDGLKIKEAEQHLGKTVPAVNGWVWTRIY